MPGARGMIRPIIVTTACDGEYRRDQPTPVIFDRALRGVQGEGNQEPFAPAYTNGKLSGQPRATADQDGPRSDAYLSRRTPRLLLGRAPMPQASRAIIKQTAMKAGATIPALSQSGTRGVS